MSNKDIMGTIGLYLPKTTIVKLKQLALAEGTSVSAIVEELIAPRLLNGPREPEPKKPNRRLNID
ncbi:hypothetical protein FEZ60_25055 [Rhodococcus sp. MS16]|uniref:hypothetical protein n=1 Tax=Rhodococcus sp. MS16 TaxID=2579941 RepID=UPI001561D434|nr:hypothetical protein [Rhodococcus sp. MS16]NRI68793.1 hypothetical protein [Rhodococcus sp. MS16]